MEHRLRCADDDDQLRVDERAIHAQRRPHHVVEGDEVRILDVMDDDVTVEPTGKLAGHEAFQLALRRPSPEPAGDEDRLIPGRDAQPLELVDDGADRELARIGGRGRDRQRRRLDDDRRPRPAPHEGLQRLALQREAEGVSDGRADVGDGRPRRRRAKDDHVVRHGRDHNLRAGQQRDSTHDGGP